MPELPEVETVKAGLQEILFHQPILTKVELRRADLRWEMPEAKLQALQGLPLISVGRRAKYLWFETSKGLIISHLGMTGSWRLREGEDLDRHDHVIFYLSDGRELVFRDPRRFGILDVAEDLSGSPFSEMGPEPLSKDFSAKYLQQKLKGKKLSIKAALMDQRIVVGIGNIYASEILFLSKVRPQRPSHRVKGSELELIVQNTRKVLKRAIKLGGSSFRDFTHTNGKSGNFQDEFKVYGREGEACPECGTVLRMLNISGRSSFWCSKCQH